MAGRLHDALTLPDGEMRGGQVLGGRYRLDERQQTFGEISVWAGWDETLSRSVSIYIVPPNHPLTDALLGAARSAAAAIDPRFLRVLDALPYGPSEPVTFIVCEDLPGVTLEQLLQRGPLPGLDAAWVAGELTSALAPMHEIGLGHGELSPATVLVTTTGNVRINGFLLLAVLMGNREDEPRQRERDDVQAVGRLLYAMLTGTWPDDTSPSPPRTYGLPPAHWRNDELVPATVVQPGVPPVLDAICMQTLQPRPDAAPLRSVTAISVALRRVLGSVDAASDLAARVADSSNPESWSEVEVGQSTNDLLKQADATVDPGAETEVIADASGSVSGLVQPTGETSRSVGTSGVMPKPPPPPRPSGDPGLPQAPRMVRAGRRIPRWFPRWWPAVPVGVLAVVVLLLVLLIAKSCGAGPLAPPPTPEPVRVTALTEFDPVTDGGDTKEHPDQVPLAIDGDPTTCWYTETYGADYLPGKKPGVGLVLDFGVATKIATVTLTVDTTPVTMSVMVPKGDAAQIDTAPMASVTDWTNVMDATIDAIPQTLTLPSTVTSRYVLLYFTKLPPFAMAEGYTQAGVCEITATGNPV